MKLETAASVRGTDGMRRTLQWLGLLLWCLITSACQAQSPANRPEEVMLTGIDHLPDHLSVQHFTVNGTDGYQAGDGARELCCASLPLHWTPGLTVKVTWDVGNWRDCTGERHEAVIPVAAYDHPAHMYVHFMRDGSVRVVSSEQPYWPPNYPDPDTHIPQKEPWNVWPPMQHCPQNFKNPDLIYNM